MSEIEYSWKTIEEMAQMAVDGKTVDFTFDTPEDLDGGFEPSDWFGLKLTNDFDGTSLVVGYYGGGIVWACALNYGFNTMLKEVKFGIERYLEWYEVCVSDFSNRKMCVDIGKESGNKNG